MYNTYYNKNLLTSFPPYLLGGAADKGAGVEQGVELAVDRRKVRRLLHPFDEVVVAALHLDHARSLVGKDADLLMANLLTEWV